MSNSRSPRAVRSMTIGISGMRPTLAARGSPHPGRRRQRSREAPGLAERPGGRMSELTPANAGGGDMFDDAMTVMPRTKRALPAAALFAILALAVPALAMTSHAGWPPDQHLVM